MRLVILSDRIPPDHAGGAERVAWSLALGLRDAGHEVHVITTTPGQPFEAIRDGISTYHLHTDTVERWRAWRSVYNRQTIPELLRLIQKIQPDVVNAHNVHNALSWGALAEIEWCGFPVVFTAHDMMSVAYTKVDHFINPQQKIIPSHFNYHLPPFHNLRQMRLRYNPLRNGQIRGILKTLSARVSVSKTQQQALAANDIANFEVVYNGIDPQEFDLPQTEIDAFRAEIEDCPTILFAGRLSAEKGAYLLLDALAQVRAQVPKARLLLLGKPELAEPILASRPDLRDAVQFGGWLTGRRLAAAFCAADVIAVPSIFLESLPLVALEGMAAGRPVVVSCFGGLPETIEDGKSGFIVNPFDTARMAERLTYLLTHPDEARAMGSAGRARIREHFTLQHQVAQMTAIFERVRRR
jgi:glycosyltransferase involved in cell wall biosynthesis